MLLTCDFDVDPILSGNTNSATAVVPDSNNILETPLLAVGQVNCNCSNVPDTDKVSLPPLDDTPEIKDSQEPTESTRGNTEDGQEYYIFSQWVYIFVFIPIEINNFKL